MVDEESRFAKRSTENALALDTLIARTLPLSRATFHSDRQWTNVVLRAVLWFVAFAAWAYYKKPTGIAFMQVRGDLRGVLGLVLLLFGLGLHLWSTVTLARASAPLQEQPSTSSEPATRRRIGASYEEHCRLVPRWFPRLSSRRKI